MVGENCICAVSAVYAVPTVPATWGRVILDARRESAFPRARGRHYSRLGGATLCEIPGSGHSRYLAWVSDLRMACLIGSSVRMFMRAPVDPSSQLRRIQVCENLNRFCFSFPESQ